MWTQLRRPTAWPIIALADVLVFTIVTRAESVSPKQSAISPPTKTIAAQTTRAFLQAWSRNDVLKLERQLNFPFVLFLPCKNAPVQTFEEWQTRLGNSRPKPGDDPALGVDKVITLVEYSRLLGLTPKDLRYVEKLCGNEVLTVCLRGGGAILVYVRDGKGQVRGLGMWK